jgi:orotate phosphoribosyltransferase
VHLKKCTFKTILVNTFMISKPDRTARQIMAAQDTAKTLLSLNAVRVYTDRPFIYTSGWASPVYVDCRKLMSDPVQRTLLMDHAAELLRERLGDSIDCIAGTETAGIPFACWIAERLSLPMVYVRKKAMGWGMNAQIEGDLPKGARCLLVDDLTTDGLSKVGAAVALRQAGAIVQDVFVIFNYDIYPQSKKAYSDNQIELHALATWGDIFALTKAISYFAPDRAQEIKSFLHDPIRWSLDHGGAGSLPPDRGGLI